MVASPLPRLWLALALLMASPGALASIEARVDRDRLQLGETLTLVLSVEGRLAARTPDLRPLHDEFELLSQRQSSRHSLVNGQRQSVIEWHIELLPRQAGVLTLPALKLAGQQTEPLAITVLPAAEEDRPDTDRPLWIEARLDRDRVHVHQQVLLTVRIHVALELENMSLTEPELKDATLRRVHQTRYHRRQGQIDYQVHELVYALFPTRPGEYTLPGLTFTGLQRDSRQSLFSLHGGRPVHRRSQPLELTVLPLPPEEDGDHWLPAESVTLQEQWQGDPDRPEVGEALSRRIELVVRGQPASQLPVPALPEVPGLQQFTDLPQREEDEGEAGVTARLSLSTALVPTRAGEFTLPPVRIPWWNVQHQRMEVAELPGRRLSVVASTAPGPAPVTLPRPDPEESTTAEAAPGPDAAPRWPWQLGSALLGALWLGTLGLWWHSRRPPPPRASAPDEAASWRALQRALSRNDPVASRQALLHWASQRWAPRTFSGLEALARFMDDPELSQAVTALQRQLYSPDPASEWRGQALQQALTALRRQASTASGAPPSPSLNPWRSTQQ